MKAGGVKFGGKMISADQRAPKAYALDASILAKQHRRLAAAASCSPPCASGVSWKKLPGSKAYRDNILRGEPDEGPSGQREHDPGGRL